MIKQSVAKILSAASLALLTYSVVNLSGAGYSVEGAIYFNTMCVIVALTGLLLSVKECRLRVTSADWAVVLFVAYTIVNFIIKECDDVNKLSTLILLSGIYLSVRVFSLKNSENYLLFILFAVAIYESILGIRQIYGFSYSNHSLFKITGTFFNPAPYSCFIVSVFAIALSVFLKHYRTQDRFISFKRLMQAPITFLNQRTLLYLSSCITLLVTFVVVPATMSRTGWGALILSAATVVIIHGAFKMTYNKFRFWTFKRKIWLLSSATLVLILGIFGAYMLKQNSADGRVLMWRMSCYAISDHPITGVGLGNFGGTYADAQSSYFESGKGTRDEIYVAGNPAYAFNEYLQTTVEGGVVALVLFVFVIILSLIGLYKKHSHLFGGLIAFCLFSMSSYPLSVLSLSILFVILIAYGVGCYSMSFKNTRSRYVLMVIFIISATAYSIYNITNKHTINNAKIWSEIKPLYSMKMYDNIVADYDTIGSNLLFNSELMFEWGHCLNKVGRYGESNDVLIKGARMNSDPMFWNIIGNNYKAKGDYVSAERAYNRAYYIVPARMYPLYLKAKMFAEIGDTLRAINAAEIVSNFVPKVPSSATDDMQREARHIIDSLHHKIGAW